MQYTSAENTAIDAAVFSEQIALLFRKRFDLAINLVVSTLLTIMLWQLFPAWLAASWLAALWIVILARAAIRYHFQVAAHTGEMTRRSGLIYTVATSITALLWGVSGSVVLVTSEPTHYVLIVFVLAGMMAGGIVTNAAYLPALVAFLVPTVFPTIVMLLTRPNMTAIEMGVMLAIFAAVLTLSGKNINQTIIDSLRLRMRQQLLTGKLRASEEAMAEAQKMARVGALEYDVSGNTTHCSAETFRIFGVDPATFKPSFESLTARIHPEDREAVVKAFADLTRTGRSDEVDWRVVMDDGMLKYVHAKDRAIDGSDGEAPRLFSTLQDVTEQRKSADELAYRDRLLHAVTAGTAILLQAESIDLGMPEALRTLGESMRLDRIDVIEEAPRMSATLALRYNWEAQDNPVPFQASSFAAPPANATAMACVRAHLADGEVVIGQRATREGPLIAMMERLQSKSLLLVPIIVDHKLWGNLGADTCREARAWSATEIDTLKTFASIVGSLVVRNEARLSLETSEQRFRILSTTAQDAIITMDEAGSIRNWNRSAERILGYSAEEAMGKSIHDFMVPARFKETAARGLAKFLSTGDGNALGKTLELAALRKDGTEIIVEVSLAGAHIGNGWQAIGILRDVSARKQSEDKLQFANMLLKTEMEASPDGILVVDANRKIISVNRRFVDMWGIPSATLDFFDDDPVLAAVVSAVKDPKKFADRVEYLYAHPQVDGDEEVDLLDGRIIDRRTATLTSPAGAYLGRVWYFRDITSRKRAESLAIRMAHYDVLTGLANRGVFVEALERSIADAKRGKKGFAVVYLDLDHFKDVNDTLGHPVGDEFLQAVAIRLRANTRAGDTIARFGGDEFAMVLTDVGEPDDAALVADKLLLALADPFLVQGNDIRTGASIGIDLYGPDSAEPETLLSHADVALYRAKSEGRGGYRFFTDSMDREVRTRVTLGAQLRTAVATGQFFLVYQPQVAMDTGRITGLEALVRWHHPTRGILGPDLFIPVAESTGIIVAIGQWVLLDACRQAKAWLDAGIEPVRVAVNVSGLQFRTPLELENNVATALAETGMPPRLLEIELTETVLMDVSLEHSEALARLRGAGVTIAIDDFGTGCSSLGYLRRFPVDRIKIARDFVDDLPTLPGQAAIAKATIGLARDLGIAVIAEGVETVEQLDALKSWGCEEIQGFYFSKPLSVEDVTLVLRNGGVIRPLAVSNA